MKTETNIKVLAFDWVFKGLIGVLCFFVKDMHNDIKQLMQTVPAIRAELDMMKDQRLIEKFRTIYQVPMKDEEAITFDSLSKK